jgi:hypothetical protein
MAGSGSNSHPSSERAAVTPLVPPSGRQHLHRRDRSTAKAIGGGLFEDRSGAPLISEESCGVWQRLQLGDVGRVAVVPLQRGERAFLRGLTRSLSSGVRSVRLLLATSSFDGRWVHGLSLGGVSASSLKTWSMASWWWARAYCRWCGGSGGRRS